MALRQLIAAVKRQPNPAGARPQLATEFLADSYYEQSRAVPGISLPAALDSARRAVTNSPEFGFGWERVAELEFSFGHTSRALEALDKSLMLAPRNAQAPAAPATAPAPRRSAARRESSGMSDILPSAITAPAEARRVRKQHGDHILRTTGLSVGTKSEICNTVPHDRADPTVGDRDDR